MVSLSWKLALPGLAIEIEMARPIYIDQYYERCRFLKGPLDMPALQNSS